MTHSNGRAVRYSIVGVNAADIASVGGLDIRDLPNVGVVFAVLTEEQALQLQLRGATVSPVRQVEAPVMPPAPVEAAPIFTMQEIVELLVPEEVRKVTEPPLYGEGFNLAIIDSGIRETHEQIAGKVVHSKNFTADLMEDGFDHGTGVASMALAIAPKCSLLNLKVLNSKGEGTDEETVAAIDYAISLKATDPNIAPHAMNLSLGTPDTGDPNEPLRVAARAALGEGIWVFAAAGNSGPYPQTIMSPAAERYVHSAGAARYLPDQKSFAICEWSSRGPTKEGVIKPDGVYFGENMVVASSRGDTAYIGKSGTSFAQPLGAAMGILYLEGVAKQAKYIETTTSLPADLITQYFARYVSPQVVMDEMLPRVCIKPTGLPVKDNTYGYGLPFGPAFMRLVSGAGGAAGVVDMSGFLSLIMTIPLMGMLLKTMSRRN